MEIAHVLHNACMIDGIKTNVMSAIDIMVESLKRIILNKSDEELKLPIDEVAPKTGTVRLLKLTEKQFEKIYMVTGETDYQEKTVGANCHIMI